MAAHRHYLLSALAASLLAAGCALPLPSALGVVSISAGRQLKVQPTASLPLHGMNTLVAPPQVQSARQGHGTITVGIGSVSRLKTQAKPQRVEGDVTFYEIELIKDQGSPAGTDYTNATMGTAGRIVASAYMDGLSATVVTGGTIVPDATSNRQLSFTQVPAGTYRIRVKAKMDATVPGTQVINKPDSVFTNADGWVISGNVATVTNGNSVTSFSSGSALTAAVALHDVTGETVGAAIVPFDGDPILAISSTNF